jgi:hypothetical protein
MTTFDKIKTAAIARLEAGEDLDYILQDYADYEEELRPILEDMSEGSLGRLARSPKPVEKPKVKAKHATATPSNWKMPAVVSGLVVALFLGVLLAAFVIQGNIVSTEDITVVDPITPISAQTNNDMCAGLDQQQVTTTYTYNQSQVGSVDEPVAIEGGIAVYGEGAELALPTGTPAPTMSDLDGESRESAVAGMPAVGDEEKAAPVGEMVVVTSVASMDMRDEAEEAPADYYGSDDTSSVETRTDSIGRSGDSTAYEPVVLEPLRAGEIDDNVDWDTYQEYRRNYLNQYGTYSVRDVNTTDRQIIHVVDSNGLPVQGACVQVYIGEYFVAASRTFATGLTLFFPNLREDTRYVENFRLVVNKGQVFTEETVERNTIGGVTTVELAIVQQQSTVPLDVLFLLDATGSMSDEIAQLQENILAISAQVDALDANIDVRFGLVIYRDRTDEYVTRIYDFTDDVNVFQKNLAVVRADGGGDYPESMNEGLDMALNAVGWRGEAAIKLVFLVADAPPHIDYQNDADYSLLMQSALARGIKIHPIASSGLQPEGEFIMRQIGQYTMGHFIFLTYEGGVAGTAGDDRPDLGVGDAKDEQGVGDYSVSQLDELVLRLITDEINALNGE